MNGLAGTSSSERDVTTWPIKQQPAALSVAKIDKDDTYGLISVIYHALQGAETCAKYEEDARRAKNPELVAFFEECQVEQNERALRGRQLLAAYLEGMDEEDEETLEDDDAELEDEA